MNERSGDNKYQLFSCLNCRSDEYHFLEEKGRCFMVDRQSKCLEYGNSSEGYKENCLTCEQGYYVKEGVCSKCIKSEKCKVVDASADGVLDVDGGVCLCEECQVGYYLKENGECVEVKDQNCKEHDEEGVCVVCKDDYYLNGSEDKCYAYSVSNCDEYDPLQNRCKSCNIDISHSYLNEDGDCVNGPIDNCLIYKDSQLCELCREDFGLTFDRKKCLDNNSNDINQGGEPHCYIYHKRESVKHRYVCQDCKNSNYSKHTAGKLGYAPDFSRKI